MEGNNTSLLSPMATLESAFHRRDLGAKSAVFSFHNHILQGQYLRFMKDGIKRKEMGKYRLTLVQGTRKGRMSCLRLDSTCEIVPSIVDKNTAELPYPFLITISGFDPWNVQQLWQICISSQEEQNLWLEAFNKAKYFVKLMEETGQADSLRDLAFKMKQSIPVRKHLHHFRLRDNCFNGKRALRWLTQELACTTAQALVVLNKMLNLDLFHHIEYEHIFCNKKLIFQFDMGTLNADGDNIESMIIDQMHHTDNNKLLSDLHKSKQELHVAQLALRSLQKKIDSLEDFLDSCQSAYHKQTKESKLDIKIIIFLELLIVVICLMNGKYDDYLHQKLKKIMPSMTGIILIILATFELIFKKGILSFTSTRIREVKFIGLEKHTMNHDNADVYILDSHSNKHDESPESQLPVDALDEDDDVLVDEDVLVGGDEEEDDDGENDDSGDDDFDSFTPSSPKPKKYFSLKRLQLNQNIFRRRSSNHDANQNSSDQKRSFLVSPMKRKISIPKAVSHNMARALASLPPVDKWPNKTVLIRRAFSMLPSSLSDQEKIELTQPLQIHKPLNPEVSEFPLESDLFIGKGYILIADLSDSPHAYFRKKQRKFQVVIQGRFKKNLPYSSVNIGEAFDDPLSKQPSKLFSSMVMNSLHKFQPSSKSNMKCQKPYVITPLISSVQQIIISKPGKEPSISSGIHMLQENMALLDPMFDGMSSQKRKQFFSRRANLSTFNYSTEHVYTFDFYHRLLNFSTFQIDFGVMKFDLLKIIGARPLQIMAVVCDTNNFDKPINESRDHVEDLASPWKFLFNLEVWNRRCIPDNAL